MPGCQSYALTSRSRSPLLLSLPQQTMNWEWKSVGKQGKYEKAPLWAWKREKKIKNHRSLVSDNHIARLGTNVLYIYAKPVQDSFAVQAKVISPAPWIKGQATSSRKSRGTERRGWTWMERKGSREPGSLLFCQRGGGHPDPSCKAGGSCPHSFPKLWHRQNRQMRLFYHPFSLQP